MEDPVVTDTNRYYDEQANLERIHEGIEEEVSKMSLRDVVWEIKELNSNQKLLIQVFDLIIESWRKHNPSYEIENILDALVNENMVTFIEYLGIESKVREMLIDTMTDREVSELE